MEITWHGHSAVRLVSSEVALLTDPPPGTLGALEADIVAVTNGDPSQDLHFEDGPKLIHGPGQYEAQGFNITGIGTALGDPDGGRSINTVYVIRAEGLSVCHLGALGSKLSGRQLDSLGAVDALITPLGGGRMLAPQDIAQLIGVLSPRILIPVEYDPDDTAPLTTLLGHMSVEMPDAVNRLNITETNLPGEMRVVVMRLAASRRR